MILISTAQLSANSMFATLSDEEVIGVDIGSSRQQFSKEGKKVEFKSFLAKNTITYDTGKYQTSDEFKQSIPAKAVILKGRNLTIADWVNGKGEKAWAQDAKGQYYEFDGWSTTENGEGTVYQPGDTFKITQNITLYAVWMKKEVDKFEVKYYKNCEDTSVIAPVDGQHYKSGDKFTVKGITDIREGYTFEGWSTNKDATTPDEQYEVGNEVEIIGDVALYAVWKAKKYKVTYDANIKDLEDVTATPEVKEDSNEYTINQTVTVLDAIEIEDYIFKGWSTTKDGEGTVYQPGDTFKITQNITLYAVWMKKEVDKFEVKYYKNCEDTSVIAPVDGQHYKSGDKFTVKGITDIREGYTFEGWSTNKDATTPDEQYEVGNEVEIIGDVTLYAVWKETVIVEFMVKYENCDYPNVTAPEDNKKYKEGSYAKVLPIVGERDGYIFKGYYEKTNPLRVFQPGEQIEMKKSVVLVAKWEKAVYYVSLRYFNNSSSDDGQVLLKEEKYEKGGKVSVLGASALGASNSGYNFKGWNTKNDGTGKNYQPGNTIEMTDNIDLFAFWERVQEEDQDNESEEPKDEPGDYNPDVPEPPKEDIEFTEDQNQIDNSGFVFDPNSGEGSDDAVEEEENQELSMDSEGLSLDSELAGDEELEDESDSQINIRRRYVIKHLYYTVVNGKLQVVDTVLTPEDGVSEVENDISEAVVHTLDKDGYTYVSDDSLDMVYDEENDIYTISLKYYDFAAIDYMGSLQGHNDVKAVEENKDWADDLVDTGLLIGSIAAVLILLGGMIVVKFGFIKKQ